MYTRLLLLLTVLQVSLLGQASAQDIVLTGGAGIEVISTNYLRLYSPEITNYRPPGSISGSLAFQLWATYTPYNGGTIIGYRTAHGDLGQLEGGYYMSNVYTDVYAGLPPRGYYYLTLVLAEYNGSGFVIQDGTNFAGPQYFDGPVYSYHLPSVKITSPRKGSTVEGKKITIAGTTTDDIAVSLVKVYLNNKLVRSFYPLNSRWRVIAKNARTGKNTVKVIAFDQGGLSTTRTSTFTGK